MSVNLYPEQFVPNWFRKGLYQATYNNFLNPVGGTDFWPDQSQFSTVLPPILKKMPGRPRKKRIRAKGEGGSGTRVSKVGTIITCGKCLQQGHNKKGCKFPTVPKPPKVIKKAGRPRKDGSASAVGGSTNGQGVSASDVGGSANAQGGSTSGVGGNGNAQGGSASAMGGSANVQGGSTTGVRGSDIPRMNYAATSYTRAFNRVSGINFANRASGSQTRASGSKRRPSQQQQSRGFSYWFGDDDSGTQQASQTEVEVPTQEEIQSQATNDFPTQQSVQQPIHEPIQQARQPPRPRVVVRQRNPSERIMKNKLAKKVHGEGSTQHTHMNLE